MKQQALNEIPPPTKVGEDALAGMSVTSPVEAGIPPPEIIVVVVVEPALINIVVFSL